MSTSTLLWSLESVWCEFLSRRLETRTLLRFRLQAHFSTFPFLSHLFLLSHLSPSGPNGAGKSTLMKLLVGDLNPSSGFQKRNPRLRIGIFTQHHIDQLDLTLSAVAFLAKRFPGRSEQEYRSHLGSFGITGMTGLQKIGTLSGGQKSRVAFSTLSLMRPHILLLDEPTNHLDTAGLDSLTDAINSWNGGVIVISHGELRMGIFPLSLADWSHYSHRKFSSLLIQQTNASYNVVLTTFTSCQMALSTSSMEMSLSTRRWSLIVSACLHQQEHLLRQKESKMWVADHSFLASPLYSPPPLDLQQLTKRLSFTQSRRLANAQNSSSNPLVSIDLFLKFGFLWFITVKVVLSSLHQPSTSSPTPSSGF